MTPSRSKHAKISAIVIRLYRERKYGLLTRLGCQHHRIESSIDRRARAGDRLAQHAAPVEHAQTPLERAESGRLVEWHRPVDPRRTRANRISQRSPPSASPGRCTALSCSTQQATSCAPRSSGTTSARRRSVTKSPSGSASARLIQLTGNRALTGFTAPKILWVRENEPEIYARAATCLAAQRLHSPDADGRLRHGYVRRFRHIAARRCQPPLVERSPRRARHSGRAGCRASPKGRKSPA